MRAAGSPATARGTSKPRASYLSVDLPLLVSMCAAAYLGNVGHKLGWEELNINMIPLGNGHGPAVADRALLLFPQFNQVAHKFPPWGNSTYHALNLKAEKRYSHGLNFLMNYTWS